MNISGATFAAMLEARNKVEATKLKRKKGIGKHQITESNEHDSVKKCIADLQELRSSYTHLIKSTDSTSVIYPFNNKMKKAALIATEESQTELFYAWCEEQSVIFFDRVKEIFSDELTNVFEFDHHHGSYFKFKDTLCLITYDFLPWDDAYSLAESLEDMGYCADANSVDDLRELYNDELAMFNKFKDTVEAYNNRKENQEVSFKKYIRSHTVMKEAVQVVADRQAVDTIIRNGYDEIVGYYTDGYEVADDHPAFDEVRAAICTVAKKACIKPVDCFYWDFDPTDSGVRGSSDTFDVVAELFVDYTDGSYSDDDMKLQNSLRFRSKVNKKDILS